MYVRSSFESTVLAESSEGFRLNIGILGTTLGFYGDNRMEATILGLYIP